MVAALRAAQVWSLVDSLPSGLETVVGDRGHRLSGGEKQRLAIARLLLKGPGLIVLDEATAHLDSESEQALQRALDHALRDRSALVIAHRLSTVRHADLILVVDDGRIVERGTHAQLVGAGGLYAELLTAPSSIRRRASGEVLDAHGLEAPEPLRERLQPRPVAPAAGGAPSGPCGVTRPPRPRSGSSSASGGSPPTGPPLARILPPSAMPAALRRPSTKPTAIVSHHW